MSAWERALQQKRDRSLSAQAARYQGQADRQFGKQSQQSAWERSLRRGNNIAVSTPPKAPDYVPGGEEDGITTSPSDSPKPDPYPSVLPSLSAEQLGVLAERRRIADKRLKQAETESEKRKELLEANADRARKTAERESRRSIEDFMRETAGRGLARSPMVAGRGIRRAGEDLRLTYGEIDTKLSTEISALQDMVSRAELARSEEIASIEQDKVNMRTDLERLLPASQQYS